MIIVIDKPPGWSSILRRGTWSGTLLNGLLAYGALELAGVPRAGIVHRLDADTSGLMVVARTLAAQAELVRQLQAATVHRECWAVVLGETRRHGIGRCAARARSAVNCASVSHASNARVGTNAVLEHGDGVVQGR